MIFETGLSTLNISRAKRAPNTINFVDLRLVLVFFLATFLHSLFNLFNVQNLIGRGLRVLGKHLRAKGWKQAIPILRIIRWIVRICKLVWVEIRHNDQINVCRENQWLRWLKFWTDSCSVASCAYVLSSKNCENSIFCRYFRFDWHCGRRKTKKMLF